MHRKKDVFAAIESLMKDDGFNISSRDEHRPWGGFFVIDEAQSQKFAKHYFGEEYAGQLKGHDKISPKILMVAPGHRLSWQYHLRRAELWKCIKGSVEVLTSDYDESPVSHHLSPNETLFLRQGKRHRLVGLNDWGIVAEIWQHTDPENPSDEDDIIRLQDDYSRK